MADQEQPCYEVRWIRGGPYEPVPNEPATEAVEVAGKQPKKVATAKQPKKADQWQETKQVEATTLDTATLDLDAATLEQLQAAAVTLGIDPDGLNVGELQDAIKGLQETLNAAGSGPV